MRERNSDLKQLKSPLLDPLRKEPRFQAIERAPAPLLKALPECSH